MMEQKKLSETAFSSQVEDLLKIFGWRWCHFRPARTQKGWRTPLTGDKGLPDYICVRPPRLIFAELKDQYSKLSPEQEGWFEDLKECVRQIILEPLTFVGREAKVAIGKTIPTLTIPEVYLWRPDDIEEIEEILL